MPNNEDEWIDKALEGIELVSSMSGNDTGKYWIEGLPEAKATIKAKLLESRLDELGGVQLEYGNYRAQTFVNGQAMTVEDRYAQLQASAPTKRGV